MATDGTPSGRMRVCQRLRKRQDLTPFVLTPSAPIFYVLRTGCQWQALDQTELVAHSTVHDRFQARGLAVARLWAVHQQFIGWLAGSVFVSAILSALLASWLITGRAPWITYADHARQLSHGMIFERAWPKLSANERQRIEQAARR